MLNSKERAHLRSLSNDLPTLFQIGKDGISEKMVKNISDCIDARELIKLRVLENSGVTAAFAAEEIALQIGAEVVFSMGSRFVLYKKAKKSKIGI